MRWRKSSFSTEEAECVEVAYSQGVQVRDSKAPDSGQLALSETSWHRALRSLSGPVGHSRQ